MKKRVVSKEWSVKIEFFDGDTIEVKTKDPYVPYRNTLEGEFWTIVTSDGEWQTFPSDSIRGVFAKPIKTIYEELE